MNRALFACLLSLSITMPIHAVRVINSTGIPYQVRGGVYSQDRDTLYCHSSELNCDEETEIPDVEFLFVRGAINELGESYFIDKLNNSQVVELFFYTKTEYDSENEEFKDTFISWEVSEKK